MSKFKKGDKVRITKSEAGSKSKWAGFEATVLKGEGEDVYLSPNAPRPDEFGLSNFYWEAKNLELVNQFKVNDRVCYVGRLKDYQGRVGRITRITETFPYPLDFKPDDESYSLPVNADELKAAVESPVAPFKVGDLVRVKDNRGAPSWIDKGKVYSVTGTELAPGAKSFGLEPWWLIQLDSGFENGKKIGSKADDLELATPQVDDRVQLVKTLHSRAKVGETGTIIAIKTDGLTQIVLDNSYDSQHVYDSEFALLPHYDSDSRGKWTIARRDTYDPYFSHPWMTGGYVRPYSGYDYGLYQTVQETPLQRTERLLQESRQYVAELEDGKWKAEQKLKAYEEEVARLNKRIETRTRDYQ